MAPCTSIPVRPSPVPAAGIIETSLALTAGGSINLTDTNTDVDNLAVSAAGQTVTFNDADDLTISTVDGIVGSTSSDLSLNTIGTLSLAAAITSSGTTSLISTADDAGAVTFNQGGQTLSSSSGALTITADDMTLDGTITATGQSVTLQSNTGGDTIDIGSTGTTTINRLELSNAELQTIAGSSLTIGSGTAGAVALVTADVTPGSTAGADLATVHIRSGSAITGTAAGIIETNLALSAGGTINLTDANTDVDNLAVSAAGQTVTFTDSDDVDLDTVDSVTAITAATFNLNTAGAVTDTAASTISGTTTIAAGTGNNITLNNANDFGTPGHHLG